MVTATDQAKTGLWTTLPPSNSPRTLPRTQPPGRPRCLTLWASGVGGDATRHRAALRALGAPGGRRRGAGLRRTPRAGRSGGGLETRAGGAFGWSAGWSELRVG